MFSPRDLKCFAEETITACVLNVYLVPGVKVCGLGGGEKGLYSANLDVKSFC